MPRYHVTAKGDPAICRAQTGNCPLREEDGSASPHGEFDSAREASAFAEKVQENRAELEGLDGIGGFSKRTARELEVQNRLNEINFMQRSPEDVKSVLDNPGRPDGLGTIEDPISVADIPNIPEPPAPPGKGYGQVKEAIRLIAEGKHIRMKSAEEYSTMLDKLHSQMDELGMFTVNEQAENWWDRKAYSPINISLAGVPGTNIFGGGNLGVNRIDMPQTAGKPNANGRAAELLRSQQQGYITKRRLEGAEDEAIKQEMRDAGMNEINLSDQYEQALKDKGINLEYSTMQEQDLPKLKATQDFIDGSKIYGMAMGYYAKYERTGRTAGPKESIVTTDGYVVDGHHGWAAVVMYNKLVDDKVIESPKIALPVKRVPYEIGATLDFTNEFCKDWDMPFADGQGTVLTKANGNVAAIAGEVPARYASRVSG
jgi:hypothetical protein